MLFNMKNPDNGDFSVIPPIVAKDNSKDSAIIKQRGGINYYAVFEPEQIHILGSKQDIEGFSNWVESGLQPTIDLQSIGVTQQEWSTLTQEEKEMIKQQNTICK
jgi:hypothetical protein